MDEVGAKQLFARTGITIGETLGDRYQVTEVLGQGGMGTVFKAINLSLNKPVAIKALHMFLDKFASLRFQQEIKAMSMLSHPNLISVLDAGTTPGGTPYFVMEFLDGPPLGDLIRNHGSLSDTRAIRMFIQIADALAYAHEQGIIHRDLKPNNIVVLSNRGKDFIKLVDLGIAKLMTPTEGEQQGLTVTGEIFGSPIYMSPEQCSGKLVDGRSDIYSLGCLMYETVCGVPPIRGGSALETFNLHMTMESPLISKVPGIQMTPALRALEPVITRCIRIKPEARFQTMGELSQALEEIDRSTAGASAQSVVSSSISQSAPPVRANFNPNVELDRSDDIDSTRITGSNVDARSSRNSSAGFAQPSKAAREKDAGTGGALEGKNLLLGAGAFVLVFSTALAIGQSLFHRSAPPPVPVPTFVQNSQPYQNSDTIQNALKDLAAKQLSQHCTVSYPNNSSNSNVEVVAVYMGKDQEAGNLKLPGNVTVNVKYAEKPVTLVLVSYMPTNWKIMRDGPAVKISRVMVSSYMSPVTVTGVPSGVPVEKSWYQYLSEDGQHTKVARTNPFQFFSLGTSLNPNSPNVEDSSDFQNMKTIVESHLHEPIKSFQGAYSEGEFTVK